MRLTAFSKLVATLAVTVWTFLLPLPMLLGLLALEIVFLFISKPERSSVLALVSLLLFTGLMVGLQLIFSDDVMNAMLGGLRMLIMTTSFLCLFANTRIQDITQALVEKFHLPREYAFMLTAALRFVPDFLADSKATLDAQSCRGYSNSGNPVRRCIAYLAVVKPLVLRAIVRSETLALSLELKGFGSQAHKGLILQPLKGADYVFLTLLVLVTAGSVFLR